MTFFGQFYLFRAFGSCEIPELDERKPIEWNFGFEALSKESKPKEQSLGAAMLRRALYS